jgi:hypothetical protein
MFRVRDPQAFDSTPELGMGFHFGIDEAGNGHIVVNGVLALSAGDIMKQTVATKIAPTGTVVVESGDADLLKKFDLPYRNVKPFNDVDHFLKSFGHLVSNPEGYRTRKVLHASPPFVFRSKPKEQFARFSAFLKDRRIQPDGSLLPGTYVTSKLDANFATSGFAVVGRYALPNIMPAVHRFDIVVSGTISGLVGTVAPAFAQSGGGVEIEFTAGAPAGSVTGGATIPEY